MKTLTTLMATLTVAAGLTGLGRDAEAAVPAPAAEAPAVGASAALPVFSAYVWRGQVLNDELVAQPNATITKGGFSFNAWGNYNFTDRVSADTKNEFSEIDLTLSYSFAAGPLQLGIGVIQYLFPNQTVVTPDASYAALNTRELYVSVGLPGVPLSPTVTVYRDLDEVDGFYASLSLGHTFAIADTVSLSLAASAGYGDEDYNTVYFGVTDAKPNDGNVSVSLPIKLGGSLTLTPLLQYTWLLDGDIEDAAAGLYKDDGGLWGGLTLSYTF